jgi:hypothetical protein
MGCLLSLMSFFSSSEMHSQFSVRLPNSLRGFRSGVSGSDHIIIDVGCEMQPSHWLHTVIPAGPCKTYPSIGEFNADRMGERRNTMEEWVVKVGRDGKELVRRQIVEGVLT